jgi:hypothetical protein
MGVSPGARFPGRSIAGLSILFAAQFVAAEDLRTFTATLERNQRLLRDYRWTSRVEMTLGGHSELVQVFEVDHDRNGIRRMTLAPDTDSRKRTSKKQRQLEDLRGQLQRLIDAYLLPDRVEAGQRLETAYVWQGPGESEDETRLKARNVRRQGDEVSLWLHATTGVPRKLLIVTSEAGEPVRVTTEFSLLESGPFHAATVTVETEIKEKKVVMKTENFGYSRKEAADPG